MWSSNKLLHTVQYLAEEVLRAAGVLPDLDPIGAGDRAQRGAPEVHIDASESGVPQLVVAAGRHCLGFTD